MAEGRKELRSFGLLVGGIFALIGILSYWFGRRGWHLWPLIAAAVLTVPALVAPRLLAPIHRGWMRLAEVLAWVNTRIILALAFFLMFTPIGLVRRWVAGDTLNLGFDRNAVSYRTTRPARPSSHMNHQF
jgi:saxitoxin biosynthesis operon SxtJ-like protein